MDPDRALRWLLGGSAVSMLGSRVTSIAYPMLILYLHGSPVTAGLAVAAANAPSVLLYLPAGALVARWDPRETLLAAEVGRAIAIGGIVVMLAAHWANLWLIILVAVMEESLEVFSQLADRRCLQGLVDQERVRSAEASMEMRTHLAVLFGRALGGALFGVQACLPFVFDALSFVPSVGSLAVIRHSRPVSRPPRRRRLSDEIRDGVRTLIRDPYARDASVLDAAMTMAAQALILVFLAQAHATGLRSLAIGAVLASSGVGGALGAVVSRRMPQRSGRGAVKLQPVIWSLVFGFLGVTSLCAEAGTCWLTCMAIAMTVLGFTGAMANVELNTYLTKMIPDGQTATVFGISLQLSFAASALGPVLGGGIDQLAGGGTSGMRYVVWVLLAFSVGCTRFAFRKPLEASQEGRRYISRARPRLHRILWMSSVQIGMLAGRSLILVRRLQAEILFYLAVGRLSMQVFVADHYLLTDQVALRQEGWEPPES
jgi:MFS family permease